MLGLSSKPWSPHSPHHLLLSKWLSVFGPKNAFKYAIGGIDQLWKKGEMYLLLSCELVGNGSRILRVVGLVAVLLSLVETLGLLVVLVGHFGVVL